MHQELCFLAIWIAFSLGIIIGKTSLPVPSERPWLRIGPTIADCFASGDHWMAHWQPRDDGICHSEDNPVQ